jgi:hypothetical protein
MLSGMENRSCRAAAPHAQAADRLQISEQLLCVAPLVSAHAIIRAQKQAWMRFDARALLGVARAPACVQSDRFREPSQSHDPS